MKRTNYIGFTPLVFDKPSLMCRTGETVKIIVQLDLQNELIWLYL
jgi:hypothetical protein